MFMSGDLSGQGKFLKSEACSWSHSVASLNVWGVALSSWNHPSPSECTMRMKECRGSDWILKCPIERASLVDAPALKAAAIWRNVTTVYRVSGFPSVVDAPFLSRFSFSGCSIVGYLMFYRIPDNPSTLVNTRTRKPKFHCYLGDVSEVIHLSKADYNATFKLT